MITNIKPVIDAFIDEEFIRGAKNYVEDIPSDRRICLFIANVEQRKRILFLVDPNNVSASNPYIEACARRFKADAAISLVSVQVSEKSTGVANAKSSALMIMVETLLETEISIMPYVRKDDGTVTWGETYSVSKATSGRPISFSNLLPAPEGMAQA